MTSFGKTVLLAACAAATLLTSFRLRAQVAKAAGPWQNLFGGKTLHGWKQRAGTADYRVENGTIVGTATLNSGTPSICTRRPRRPSK